MSATASASERTATRGWLRALTVAHRWLGICLGILVLAWCASGMVMMYVPYPSLTRTEALAGLSPLDLTDCCHLRESMGVTPLMLDGFRVETAAGGDPLLRGRLAGGEPLTVNLVSGRVLDDWTDAALIREGEAFAAAQGWSPPVASKRIDDDQWTVQASYDAHRPMLRLGNDDGREWYLSNASGEVVQETAAAERAWNMVGAVTHWLYPTALRRHVGLWSQVVIWLTVVSLFLTLAGIVIGISHYRVRRDRRRSPFRGWTLWHHYSGLVFGLLTLTWLASGLLSMNPWGALTPTDFGRERTQLNGTHHTVGEAVRALSRVAGVVPAGTVRLESVGWMGRSHLLAWDRDGGVTRLFRETVAGPVSLREARAAAAVLRGADVSVDELDEPDAYHYRLKGAAELPVFRLRYADGVRLYVSPATGSLVTAAGTTDRWFRWLFDALHRGDFSAFVRTRPLWDGMMLVLLGGVSLGVATGVWLGFRRVRRLLLPPLPDQVPPVAGPR